MRINDLFLKNINRQIEGVIKADDNTMLLTELEEYVITSENESNLNDFLRAYNNYAGGNGVWISGFFGSGKSHLLKMLSIVLENKTIKGKNSLDVFSKKTDDQFLRAELKKASKIPSDNILFNIDQKADVISSKQADAVLKVFLKVFNEHCGYFGKQPYIAKFERDLDKRGLLEDFKKAFQQQAKIPWEEGREQVEFETENLAQAYGEVTGNSPEKSEDILDRYSKHYHLSIEDFADMVKDYIDSKEDGFRLNFFVDEVGQYIAGETKLMTNLQTIAESLNTKCRGRAWLVVTAQEDMDTVIGDVGGQQSNDFSKIQDRFKIRMKLTSRDVAEVIQKRLLKKKASAHQILAQRYEQEKNNFSTLFSFSDGTKTYKNFKDQEDFIDTYPFIPYQYELFQSSIQQLSDHNALEGKHSSVGERSMLGVFQKVVQTIENEQIGKLATFDKMFEGIKNALKSSIQQAIISAERNIGNKNPLAVKLLKILLLVKYVPQFKSTPENLTTLLIDGFNVNLKKLRQDVQTALNRLETETYIQKAGDRYEYLTDEEKDVEREIKNTDCPRSEVEKELEKLIFEEIFVERKIQFREN